MEKNRRGIQSVEIGSDLLLALARNIRPMSLKNVATAADMSAGKAHPYMVTFMKVGFVTQTPAGHYELGPLALQLGLTKLKQMVPVREASKPVEDLAKSTGKSIAVAVWGNLGPTIVRLEEPTQPLHVNLRTGTVMSLTSTATGRLFSAYMPPKVIERLIGIDSVDSAEGRSSAQSFDSGTFEATLAEIRKHSLSRARGNPIPGIDALCAPVFDPTGNIVLGILAMGTSATFDSEWDGTVAKPLLACAAEISRRISRPAAQA
ncbi:IclR family transcriptional regulator [Variovorax guangxiensis]|uniref:IclR family transcriptional regulator n=1 Tax=Variovorax guangxiensis TaxID=1775474 RepID=UPI00285FB3E4|nr:IclR family transcriptional regulator [Variovorax guangxiensis]MDR6858643.1 DNA-binding IclR family transcriptional regulator [Variovorax guangxiensis]